MNSDKEENTISFIPLNGSFLRGRSFCCVTRSYCSVWFTMDAIILYIKDRVAVFSFSNNIFLDGLLCLHMVNMDLTFYFIFIFLFFF